VRTVSDPGGPVKSRWDGTELAEVESGVDIDERT